MKFEKPKLSYQCKVCGLLRTHPDIWKELHDQILNKGATQTQMAKWLNNKVSIINADLKGDEEPLPEFSKQNLSLHFKKHTDVDMQRQLFRQQMLSQGSRLENAVGFSDIDTALADGFLQETAEELALQELSEYSALTRMIGTLEQTLWKYDTQCREKDAKQPSRRVTLGEIEGYQKQIEALMKLKLDLTKLRNSSTVAGAAVRSAVEYAVGSFIEVMMGVTEESLEMLRADNPGSSLPLESTKLIRTKIGESMKASIPDIVKRVQKDFNIK